MNDLAIKYVLTEAERELFERDGYLVVQNALDVATVAALVSFADGELARFRAQEGIGPHHVLNLHDLIARDPSLLELVDWHTTFPKVWGILGWHIQLFHTQLLVTPPAPAGATPGAYGWHQDNNRMNLDLETTPQPRVSVKIGYFLSDVAAPGMANLWVMPGSHHLGRPNLALGEQPNDAVEVLARAGDAIIFDRRLWHSASTNCSDRTRIFLTYGYSYRWLRPKSTMDHQELMGAVDPIRRQLLGWSADANGYFDPSDDDVPLREWIRAHVGEDALAP